MNTQQAIDKFIDNARQVRRLSAHTVSAYHNDLKKLLAGAGEKTPAQITDTDLQRLLTAQRRAKPTTLARQLSSWRAFYKFLIDCRLLSVNPTTTVTLPKRLAHLPKALTPDEMNNLLGGACVQTEDWLVVRDRAIMELLYSSALRLSELVQLDINDLDINRGLVYVRRGKGGRGRSAPLGASARQALVQWLTLRRQHVAGKPQAALFIGQNLKRLGGRAIQKRLTHHVEKSGFSQPVSPHVFRHSCASHFLQSSGDLRATQELLGHKEIAATQIYTRLDFQHLAAVYDTAHPRARKKTK